jgi:hypothetical protein
MTKTYEIVHGKLKGNASAVMSISFDVDIADLDCNLQWEANDADDFLDYMKHRIAEELSMYIEGIWTRVAIADGIFVEDVMTYPEILELEIDAEVEEVKDDD